MNINHYLHPQATLEYDRGQHGRYIMLCGLVMDERMKSRTKVGLMVACEGVLNAKPSYVDTYLQGWDHQGRNIYSN